MNGYYHGCEFEGALVQEEEKDRRVELLLEEIEGLPSERKSQLLAKLLGKELTVVVGNSHNNHVMQADVVLQLNGISPDLVKTLIEAIVTRIKNSDSK